MILVWVALEEYVHIGTAIAVALQALPQVLCNVARLVVRIVG